MKKQKKTRKFRSVKAFLKTISITVVSVMLIEQIFYTAYAGIKTNEAVSAYRLQFINYSLQSIKSALFFRRPSMSIIGENTSGIFRRFMRVIVPKTSAVFVPQPKISVPGTLIGKLPMLVRVTKAPDTSVWFCIEGRHSCSEGNLGGVQISAQNEDVYYFNYGIFLYEGRNTVTFYAKRGEETSVPITYIIYYEQGENQVRNLLPPDLDACYGYGSNNPQALRSEQNVISTSEASSYTLLRTLVSDFMAENPGRYEVLARFLAWNAKTAPRSFSGQGKVIIMGEKSSLENISSSGSSSGTLQSNIGADTDGETISDMIEAANIQEGRFFEHIPIIMTAVYKIISGSNEWSRCIENFKAYRHFTNENVTEQGSPYESGVNDLSNRDDIYDNSGDAVPPRGSMIFLDVNGRPAIWMDSNGNGVLDCIDYSSDGVCDIFDTDENGVFDKIDTNLDGIPDAVFSGQTLLQAGEADIDGDGVSDIYYNGNNPESTGGYTSQEEQGADQGQTLIGQIQSQEDSGAGSGSGGESGYGSYDPGYSGRYDSDYNPGYGDYVPPEDYYQYLDQQDEEEMCGMLCKAGAGIVVIGAILAFAPFLTDFAFLGISVPVIGWALIGIGALLLIFGICPAYYIYDSETGSWQYIRNGLLARTNKRMEKTDYVRLDNNIKTDSGRIRIRIAEQLPEMLYLNKVKMKEVEHSPETEVYMDSRGKIRTVKDMFECRMRDNRCRTVKKYNKDETVKTAVKYMPWINKIVQIIKNIKNNKTREEFMEVVKGNTKKILDQISKKEYIEYKIQPSVLNADGIKILITGGVTPEVTKLRSLYRKIGDKKDAFYNLTDNTELGDLVSLITDDLFGLTLQAEQDKGVWKDIDTIVLENRQTGLIAVPKDDIGTGRLRLEMHRNAYILKSVRIDASRDKEINVKTIQMIKNKEQLEQIDNKYIKIGFGENIDLEFQTHKTSGRHTYFMEVTGYYHPWENR